MPVRVSSGANWRHTCSTTRTYQRPSVGGCNEDVGDLGRGGVLRQPAGRRGGHRPGADLCPMARVVRATAVSVVAPGVRGDRCGGNRRVLGETVNRNLAAKGKIPDDSPVND